MEPLRIKKRYGAFGVFAIAISLAAAQVKAPTPANCVSPSKLVAGNFVDTTEKAGVHFLHNANHTEMKYQIETMGSGVGLFDCDNDGRLDLYLVNGASFPSPEPRGSVPQKSGPGDWNRLYHQKPEGTLEDITEKSGLQGIGLGMGVAMADYTTMGRKTYS